MSIEQPPEDRDTAEGPADPTQPDPAAHGPGAPDVPQVRPWIRFLARGIDINLWLLLLGTLWAVLDPFLPDLPWLVVTLAGLLVYNVVEAASFALYGTTPGKWLLRVYVRTAAGDHLGFRRALGRAFAVYFKGYALGIPFLNLIAMAAAYARLNEHKQTDWDRGGRFRVTHGRVGTLRALVVILLVLGYLSLSVVGYLLEGGTAA
jgi:uncharacterized RDD family membrane protein YckC